MQNDEEPIGIDGSARYKSSFGLQCEIFRSIVDRAERLGGKTLNIHSRQAVKEILTVLARHPNYGTALLHWFTGTASELRAADNMGCWFSVGPAMFVSANGRSIAGRLPRDRVVPESDGPFAEVDGKTVLPWSSDATADCLAKTWGSSQREVAERLEENSRRLLEIMGGR